MTGSKGEVHDIESDSGYSTDTEKGHGEHAHGRPLQRLDKFPFSLAQREQELSTREEELQRKEEEYVRKLAKMDARGRALDAREQGILNRETEAEVREKILLETLIPELQQNSTSSKANHKAKTGSIFDFTGLPTSKAPPKLDDNARILPVWIHLAKRALDLDKKERQVKNLYALCEFSVKAGEKYRLQDKAEGF
jgi:hypothetical protein